MREFRARHAEFVARHVTVAGVTRDSPASCRTWAKRLRLPYPLLSDETGEVGHECHVVQRLGVGGWNVEFFRRTTFLIDPAGFVRGVWGDVKIRGHAREVLRAAEALPVILGPEG